MEAVMQDGIIQERAQISYTPSEDELNQRRYHGKHVPGHACPRCGYLLAVAEVEFKGENRSHFERRLNCPGFFVNGCDYKEPFTKEILALLNAVVVVYDEVLF
jgi:hypothetical protein